MSSKTFKRFFNETLNLSQGVISLKSRKGFIAVTVCVNIVGRLKMVDLLMTAVLCRGVVDRVVTICNVIEGI